MHLKLFLGLTLAALFLGAAHPVSAQTVPAAKEGSLPLSVGAGVSYFDPDWKSGMIYGGALWVDYIPKRLPSYLHGLGIEVEARDIRFGRWYAQANLQEDTFGGGAIYSWRHYSKFHPYAKALAAYSTIDFKASPSNPSYDSDSRAVGILGAGLEYRIFRRVWLRGDYEYDYWGWRNYLSSKDAQPNGFTYGASYHLATPHFH